MTPKRVAFDGVHGEAGAVDADRALDRDVAQQRRRRTERPALRGAVVVDAHDLADAVDVAGHQWPPRRSARRSAFSRLTGSPTGERAERGERQRLGGDVDGETRAFQRDRGEADAGNRDAVADRDVGEIERRRVDDEARVVAACVARCDAGRRPG